MIAKPEKFSESAKITQRWFTLQIGFGKQILLQIHRILILTKRRDSSRRKLWIDWKIRLEFDETNRATITFPTQSICSPTRQPSGIHIYLNIVLKLLKTCLCWNELFKERRNRNKIEAPHQKAFLPSTSTQSTNINICWTFFLSLW